MTYQILGELILDRESKYTLPFLILGLKKRRKTHFIKEIWNQNL